MPEIVAASNLGWGKGRKEGEKEGVKVSWKALAIC